MVQWLERKHHTVNIGNGKAEELWYIFLLYWIFTKKHIKLQCYFYDEYMSLWNNEVNNGRGVRGRREISLIIPFAHSCSVSLSIRPLGICLKRNSPAWKHKSWISGSDYTAGLSVESMCLRFESRECKTLPLCVASYTKIGF